MRAQQLQQVCDSLGIRPGRVAKDWMPVPCPLSPWTHGGGQNSDNAKGLKAAGGLSISAYGKSKFMCRVCQHTPINLWELHQKLERYLLEQPLPRNVNLPMLRALTIQEAENVYDDLEVAAYELLGKNPDGSAADFHAEIRTREWPEEFLLNFVPVTEDEEAHRYCAVRGIPDVVLEYLGMVWDPKRRRVGFPVRDENWALVGLHGRLIDDYRPLKPEWEDHPDPETLMKQNPDCLVEPEREPPLRYFSYECEGVRNTHIWCNQHLVDMTQPVIITEGNFDYARIMAAGYYNVLGSRSAGIHGTMMLYLAKAHDIITYYDRGVGGDTARARVDAYFNGTGRRVRHCIPTELDDDAGNTPVCVIQDNLGRFII